MPRLKAGNNPDFRIKKIEKNRRRGIATDKKLFYMGWTVIHFGGTEILKNTDECVKVIQETIFDMIID